MSNTLTIVTAHKIFTGQNWLTDHSLIVINGIIADIVPSAEINQNSYQQETFNTLVPAFIDIQIYGAHERLLAVFPDADALFKLYDYCSKGGALHFMPTVATNSSTVFFECIDAVKDYWKKGGKGCLGLHIEGPWINKIKRGAHIESFIHSPSVEEVKALLEYGKGVIKIVTIAPEVCSEEVIRLIQSYNVIISAGHSNATYQQAMQGFDKGIPAITHLYNAMSSLQHREPGLVGAAFNHSSVMASIIPDGHHVDFVAVKIAKKMMQERLFVITDAVTETTEGYYPHHLAGDKYESNNILSGSALTMMKAVKNLVQYCAVDLDEALRMCSLYPAKVLGLDHELGKLAKGYKASFVELESEILPD